jgi:hypothetical protein
MPKAKVKIRGTLLLIFTFAFYLFTFAFILNACLLS